MEIIVPLIIKLLFLLLLIVLPVFLIVKVYRYYTKKGASAIMRVVSFSPLVMLQSNLQASDYYLLVIIGLACIKYSSDPTLLEGSAYNC